MGLSTYEDLWRGVMLRCPAADMWLARQWVSYAFRDLVELRRWSWLVKRGQLLAYQVVNSGLATIPRGSNIVTGIGTTWTQDLVGRQFRTGVNSPIYTILQWNSATQIILDQPWGGNSATAVNYQIYQVYYNVPTDFQSFISVIDPYYNWQLYLNVQQSELNAIDAQRANNGTPYVVASSSYNPLPSATQPPLPQYELWPHQLSNYVYPFLYISRPPDPEDPGATLPRYIPGNVLLEKAMAQCARWPGPDTDHPNPYFNLNLALNHEARADRLIATLERQDDEVYESDVTYQSQLDLPFASLPLGDAHWLQSHSI